MAKYPRGFSGNKAGRPHGATSKKLTEKEMVANFAKGSKQAMDAIKAQFMEEGLSTSKLKAAVFWLTQEQVVISSVLKNIEQELKNEKLRLELNGSTPKGGQSTEKPVHTTPVISIASIKNK